MHGVTAPVAGLAKTSQRAPLHAHARWYHAPPSHHPRTTLAPPAHHPRTTRVPSAYHHSYHPCVAQFGSIGLTRDTDVDELDFTDWLTDVFEKHS